MLVQLKNSIIIYANGLVSSSLEEKRIEKVMKIEKMVDEVKTGCS